MGAALLSKAYVETENEVITHRRQSKRQYPSFQKAMEGFVTYGFQLINSEPQQQHSSPIRTMPARAIHQDPREFDIF
ncbi:hypothetical protein, partial [Microbacterium sp. ZXX196]|uniref:hypothetical protein n=1 Tax=Microbacterium sp. ZXX196 TaxID=2609291 RepID=UPI001E3D4F15